MAPIRVLIADDHPLVRDGLSALFAQEDEFQVVAQAANGAQAVQLCLKHRPDVTLMDLGMPEMDGVEALRAIRREIPDARVLVLTMRSGDEDVQRALEAGARGYLFKDTPWPQLAEAVRNVAKGLRHVSPEAAAALAERVGSEALTGREREVLQAMASGLPNKEIGKALGVSEATVKTHVTAILGKLQVEDRTQAVVQAIRRGLVHLS
ncbi:MAG TPA: response regulator transcription factor [Myxococcales bacterium]|nr:response regulator transcription factor [Myxococcales bacterium]